jgi:hypothetical protein
VNKCKVFNTLTDEKLSKRFLNITLKMELDMGFTMNSTDNNRFIWRVSLNNSNDLLTE